MLVLEQILLGVVLPVVLAAAFLLAARRPWQKESGAGGLWGGPLAFAAAYLGVHIGIANWGGLAPSDDMQWLPHVAVAAAIVGLIETKTYEKALLRWLLRGMLAAGTYVLVLGFMIENYWTTGDTALWIGLLTLATLGITGTLDQLAEDHPGASAPLVMTLVAAGGALVLALTGTAKVGQLMGGLSAASGVMVLISWWDSSTKLSRGGATVFSILFGGLLAFGYTSTADIPALAEAFGHYQTMATLLVAAAPFMLWAAQNGPLARPSGWKAALMRALLVAIPLGAAAYFAANPPEPDTKEQELEGVDYDELYG